MSLQRSTIGVSHALLQAKQSTGDAMAASGGAALARAA
jgi:hypothetical protein